MCGCSGSSAGCVVLRSGERATVEQRPPNLRTQRRRREIRPPRCRHSFGRTLSHASLRRDTQFGAQEIAGGNSSGKTERASERGLTIFSPQHAAPAADISLSQRSWRHRNASSWTLSGLAAKEARRMGRSVHPALLLPAGAPPSSRSFSEQRMRSSKWPVAAMVKPQTQLDQHDCAGHKLQHLGDM